MTERPLLPVLGLLFDGKNMSSLCAGFSTGHCSDAPTRQDVEHAGKSVLSAQTENAEVAMHFYRRTAEKQQQPSFCRGHDRCRNF